MSTTAPPAGPLSKKDFQTDQDVRWCPGCGDYAILNAVQQVMPTLVRYIEIHGETQTFFGMNDQSFDLAAEVEVAGDSFSGTMRRTGVDQYSMEFRAIRRAGLNDSAA